METRTLGLLLVDCQVVVYVLLRTPVLVAFYCHPHYVGYNG
jgi:hypothetical protein